MVVINGRQYKLCLLDTNAVSEMIKNRNSEFQKYLNNLFRDGFIPSFSLFSIIELKQKRDLFSEFLDIFSVFPSVILKGHQQILEEEIKSYPQYNKIDPLLISLIAIKPYQKLSKRQTTEMLFKSEPFLSYSKTYLANRNTDLKAMIANAQTYLPANEKYSKEEIWLVMQSFVLKELFLKNRAFTDKRKGREIIDVNAFPSLLMMAYSIFYKFYEDRLRKPSDSDVFDVVISALVPYSDAFITERNQADAIKKIKSKEKSFITDVKILTIKDLRELQI